MKLLRHFALASLTFSLLQPQPARATVLDNISMTGAGDGFASPLPASVGATIIAQFGKYTRLTAQTENRST